ncbi:MAG TPA: type I-U CRISPR-associated helicase/endonuclease Cas3, partial [Polyangiaceae bacterium]|nr:type I-U CRISPR-associated helicase/endonuclease Cas3 [Polyangiaceae bacterium]
MTTPLDNPQEWLHGALRLDPGHSPFPWQAALLDRLCEGAIPSALDIPTGLGKTATIAIWLLARAAGAPVPRRLVYVVDRRAVVDQATAVAMGLREWVSETPEVEKALGLEGCALPISTLRGQFVDNREWLEDPAGPAIVIGTVDMVGSRLLFEGYGTSRKMRPFYAGMLGSDCLYAVDESHLVPPFEALLRKATSWHDDVDAPTVVPRCRLMSLSATGGHAESAAAEEPFRLSDEDRAHPEIARRLGADKRVHLRELGADASLTDAMVDEAWSLRDGPARRCVIFVSSRTEAARVADTLLARFGDLPEEARGRVELLTGGRRAREREEAARALDDMGFLAGSGPPDRTMFLVATAAGEVGVDLDADDMVSDLVAWERMVQRLGRVNRRGQGAARVVVFVEAASGKDDGVRPTPQDCRLALEALPTNDDGSRDGSPGAIDRVTKEASPELTATLARACTPPPLHPELNAATLEAWAMTSLVEHTGRPEVAPWLRGWDEDEPQTRVIWRAQPPVLFRDRRAPDNPAQQPAGGGDILRPELLARYLTAAPPHPREYLEVPTYQVADWVKRHAKALARRKSPDGPWPPMVVVLNEAHEAERIYGIHDGDDAASFPSLASMPAKRRERLLAHRTILLFGFSGLSPTGFLDPKHLAPPDMADAEPWVTDSGVPVPPFRVRQEQRRPADEQAPAAPASPDSAAGWRIWERIALDEDEEGEREWLVIDKWRDAAVDEEARSVARRSQPLDEHQRWA